MIQKLNVSNYALIDKLEMEPQAGFCTLTGETGSGKSILLGALGLVLGQRSELSVLKDEKEKCVIEAQFDISKYDLKDFFKDLELDWCNETILRREILPSGKSRAFVNDSPVLLETLVKLSDKLINIHSQHQTRELASEDFQMRLLDTFAKNGDNLSDYRVCLKDFHSVEKKLSDLKNSLEQSSQNQEYNSFLLQELEAAQLKENEQQELEKERDILANSVDIGEKLATTLKIFSDDEYGIIKSLNQASVNVGSLSSFGGEYVSVFERINSSAIEIKDIFSEMESLAESAPFDPQRLAFVSSRLDFIYNLHKKHRTKEINELIKIKDRLKNEIFGLEDLQEEIKTTEEELSELETSLKDKALKIREKRLSVKTELQECLLSIIKPLAMPNAVLEIDISENVNYTPNGLDRVSIMFSANLGTNLGRIEKVASGGELSRIMLAIKYVLAEKSKLPTIIFDEIDTGVSGDVAEKMGRIMRKMSNNMQVFAITHLPQIASKGSQHFKVYKKEDQNTTKSYIKELSYDQRVLEIAKMISGEQLTEAAVKLAGELLQK